MVVRLGGAVTVFFTLRGKCRRMPTLKFRGRERGRIEIWSRSRELWFGGRAGRGEGVWG